MKILLEIGLEELPSRYVKSSSFALLENFKKELTNSRINFKNEKYFNSPRRISFVIEIDEKQKDLYEKKMGPAKSLCFNENGITKAALGFLNSQNLSEKDMKFEMTDKGEYLYVEKNIKGEESIKLLPNMFDSAIRNIYFEKSMKWSDKSFRFARPIKWILALVDNKVIDFEFEGIKASNITRGMRLYGSQNIKIEKIDEYEEKLFENYVIIDPFKREKAILKSINENCENDGEKVLISKDLLDEVTNLVEYPYAIKGEFKKDYLKLPEDIITITMETHQRYFPVKDINGKLSNKFVVIRNAPEYSELVKKGNEKVIEPRLSDAKFFYDEDLKVPLENNVLKLKNVLFQKDMGSIYDKMLRSKNIAKYLIEELKLENEEDILRTIYLSKSDLLSNVISEKEFTKLQGYMGSIYAKIEGEKENVSKGIFEHYLPRYQGDILPETIEGSIASISDKLDTLVGAFCVGLIPTSSKDPYALRRSANGLVQVAINSNLNIDYEKLVKKSIEIFDKKILNEKAYENILEFLRQRVEYVFSGMYSKELIAYLISNETKLIDLKNNLEKLKELSKTEDFIILINLIKRLKNISKDKKELDINLFNLKEEEELFKLSEKLKGNFDDITLLLKEKDVINNFFEKVIINDNDEKIKNNRLSLVSKINEKISKLINV